MNKTEIREFAITGTKEGNFPLLITLPDGEAYELIIGSSNIDVNPKVSGLSKSRPVKPVSERTPNLTDMRVLRYLSPEVYTGDIIIEVNIGIELEEHVPSYTYRTTAAFLQDLENCDNDIGRMLSDADNFRLTR